MPVVQGLAVENVSIAQFAISDDGTLVYVQESEPTMQLVWVDEAGRESEAWPELGWYREFNAAPAGQRIAVANKLAELSLLDAKRGVALRPPLPGWAQVPIWTPDGRAHRVQVDRRFRQHPLDER